VRTGIQLCLLSISLIFEATVFLRILFVGRDDWLPIDWRIICGVLIGASLLPVLIVLRHGGKGPRICAGLLVIYPAFYSYTQIANWIQG
jgi:hypothetical protein